MKFILERFHVVRNLMRNGFNTKKLFSFMFNDKTVDAKALMTNHVPVDVTSPEMIEKIHKVMLEDRRLKVAKIGETVINKISETITNSTESVCNILHKCCAGKLFQLRIWHCTRRIPTNFWVDL